MRIEKSCDVYCFRFVKYLSKNDAMYYRNLIQSLIDKESYKRFDVSMSEYEWLDDDNNERYVILVRAAFDNSDKNGMTKADFYIEYNEINKKLDHIFDAVGLSERIES